MIKHNLIAALALTLVASTSFAQEVDTQDKASSASLNNAAVININPLAVLNLQLSGQASDPIEALSHIADELAAKHGFEIQKEIVGGQYILLGYGEVDAELQQEDNVLSAQALGGTQAQFAPLTISGFFCSPLSGDGFLICDAQVSGGRPPYSYEWTASNSIVDDLLDGSALIDSCAGAGIFEQFFLEVTDSEGSSFTRGHVVFCSGSPF